MELVFLIVVVALVCGDGAAAIPVNDVSDSSATGRLVFNQLHSENKAGNAVGDAVPNLEVSSCFYDVDDNLIPWNELLKSEGFNSAIAGGCRTWYGYSDRIGRDEVIRNKTRDVRFLPQLKGSRITNGLYKQFTENCKDLQNVLDDTTTPDDPWMKCAVLHEKCLVQLEKSKCGEPVEIPGGKAFCRLVDAPPLTEQLDDKNEESTAHLKVWLGVPYAVPPVGRLRWQPPVDIESNESDYSWPDSIEVGLQYGAACAQYCTLTSEACPCDHRSDLGSVMCGIQGNAGNCYRMKGMFSTSVGSEDCLTLNIFAPADASGDEGGKKYPVLVFVHGGGYNGGTAMAPLYNLNQYAALGIVAVAMNYRLGVQGYLNDPQMGIRANLGSADTVASFKWIKKHIAKFGGDPERVTLSSQSAGAMTAISMLVDPELTIVDPIVHRAILMSAPHSLPLPEKQTPMLTIMRTYKNLTCLDESRYDEYENFAFNHEDLRALKKCIMGKSTEELIRAAHYSYAPIMGGTDGGVPDLGVTADWFRRNAPMMFYHAFTFGPVCTGCSTYFDRKYMDNDNAHNALRKVIPAFSIGDQPFLLARYQTMPKRVPIMLGITSEEGLMFADYLEGELWREYGDVVASGMFHWTVLFLVFGPGMSSILQTYPFRWWPKGTGGNVSMYFNYNLLGEMLSDVFFRCPTGELASKIAAEGHDTYLYEFNNSWPYAFHWNLLCAGRKCHTSDLGYAMGLDQPEAKPIVDNLLPPAKALARAQQGSEAFDASYESQMNFEEMRWISRAFTSLWSNFVKTGNPNSCDANCTFYRNVTSSIPGGMDAWPKYRVSLARDKDFTMVFDGSRNKTVYSRTGGLHIDDDQCEIWRDKGFLW